LIFRLFSEIAKHTYYFDVGDIVAGNLQGELFLARVEEIVIDPTSEDPRARCSYLDPEDSDKFTDFSYDKVAFKVSGWDGCFPVPFKVMEELKSSQNTISAVSRMILLASPQQG